MALKRGERDTVVTQSSLASRMGVVRAYDGDGFALASNALGKTLSSLAKIQADIEETDWKATFQLDGSKAINQFANDYKFDSGAFMSKADAYIEGAINEAPQRFKSYAKQYLGMQSIRHYEQIANQEWAKRLDTTWENFENNNSDFLSKFGNLLQNTSVSEHQKIYGEQIIPELSEQKLMYEKLYNNSPPSMDLPTPDTWLKSQKIVLEQGRVLSKALEILNDGISKGDITQGYLDAQEYLKEYINDPDVQGLQSGDGMQGAIVEENPFTLVDTNPADREIMVDTISQALGEEHKLKSDQLKHALSQEETKMLALYNEDITNKQLIGSLAHPLTKAMPDLKDLEKKEYWKFLDEAQKMDIINKQRDKLKIQDKSIKLLTDGSNLRFEDALTDLDGIENAEAQLMEHMVMQEIFLTGGDPNMIFDTDTLFSDTTSLEYNALINVSKKAGRFDPYSTQWLSSLANLNVDSIEESGILGKMLTFYDMVNHGEKNIIGKELPNGMSKVLHDASKEWKQSQFFRQPENSRHFATWVYDRLHPDEKIFEKRAEAFNNYINDKGIGSVDYLKQEFMKEFISNLHSNKNPIRHISQELMSFITGGLVTDPDDEQFTQFAPAGMDWKGFFLKPIAGFDSDRMLQFADKAEELLVSAIERRAPYHLSNDPTDAEIKEAMPFIMNDVFAELNNNGYGVSTMSSAGGQPTLSQYPIEYEYKNIGKSGIAFSFANDYLINNYKAEMILSDPDATESDKDDALFYLQSLRGTNDMGELNAAYTEKEIIDMVENNDIWFTLDDDTIRDAEKGYKVQYRLGNVPTMFEPFDADRSLDDSELRFYPDSQDYQTINFNNHMNLKKIKKETAMDAARQLIEPSADDNWAMTTLKNAQRSWYAKTMELFSDMDEVYGWLSGQPEVADKIMSDLDAKVYEVLKPIIGDKQVISFSEYKKEIRMREAAEITDDKVMGKLNELYFVSEGGFHNDGYVFDDPVGIKTVGTGIALYEPTGEPNKANWDLLEKYGYNVQDIVDGKVAITAKDDFQMRQDIIERQIEYFVKPKFGFALTDKTRDWSNLQVVLADMAMEGGNNYFGPNFTNAINNQDWNKAIFELINDTGNNRGRNYKRAKLLSAYLPTSIDINDYRINDIPEGMSKGEYLNKIRKDDSHWKHLNTLTGL